jgi:outer membrane protein
MPITILRRSLCIAALGLFAVCSAHAEIKVATVNFQRLMDESNQAKAASQALQDEFSPRQRDLQQRAKDLQAKQEKLNRDGAVMAEKEKSALERDVTKAQRDLQSDGEAFTEEVNNRRNEELNKVQALLVSEIQAYAKSNGYDLILPSSVAVFAKDTLDVTTPVLAYLQSRPATAPAASSSSKSAGSTGKAAK